MLSRQTDRRRKHLIMDVPRACPGRKEGSRLGDERKGRTITQSQLISNENGIGSRRRARIRIATFLNGLNDGFRVTIDIT